MGNWLGLIPESEFMQSPKIKQTVPAPKMTDNSLIYYFLKMGDVQKKRFLDKLAQSARDDMEQAIHRKGEREHREMDLCKH